MAWLPIISAGIALTSLLLAIGLPDVMRAHPLGSTILPLYLMWLMSLGAIGSIAFIGMNAPDLSVSHLLHTRRSSHLRAFLYKRGNVKGEVLDRLIDLNVMLPGCCRPDPVVVFLQSAEQA